MRVFEYLNTYGIPSDIREELIESGKKSGFYPNDLRDDFGGVAIVPDNALEVEQISENFYNKKDGTWDLDVSIWLTGRHHFMLYLATNDAGGNIYFVPASLIPGSLIENLAFKSADVA